MYLMLSVYLMLFCSLVSSLYFSVSNFLIGKHQFLNVMRLLLFKAESPENCSISDSKVENLQTRPCILIYEYLTLQMLVKLCI